MQIGCAFLLCVCITLLYQGFSFECDFLSFLSISHVQCPAAVSCVPDSRGRCSSGTDSELTFDAPASGPWFFAPTQRIQTIPPDSPRLAKLLGFGFTGLGGRFPPWVGLCSSIRLCFGILSGHLGGGLGRFRGGRLHRPIWKGGVLRTDPWPLRRWPSPRLLP